MYANQLAINSGFVVCLPFNFCSFLHFFLSLPLFLKAISWYKLPRWQLFYFQLLKETFIVSIQMSIITFIVPLKVICFSPCWFDLLFHWWIKVFWLYHAYVIFNYFFKNSAWSLLNILNLLLSFIRVGEFSANFHLNVAFSPLLLGLQLHTC